MSATTTRALRLLSLLQARPVWTGPELADDLGVTTRTLRRDIDRLRDLGYPVRAARGVAGGYQLGGGMALPPLLLDDDEAVAVAVSLRLAAGGTVTGAGEAALRTLAKLDQVMPARLRSEIRAIAEATVTLPTGDTAIDSDVLLTVARACRDRTVVRFGYAARSGTQSRRSVEPVRLVVSERRWYLMAWDRYREDWRTFRLDRCAEVEASTFRFALREHPDPVGFVQQAVSVSPYRWQARVRVEAPGEVVRAELSSAAATVHDDGPEHCIVEAGGDDLRWLAVHLGLIKHRIEVLDPPELRVAMSELAERFAVAGAATSVATSTAG